MSDTKRIPIKEFRERGYLQELNRLFLHPLGLALEVVIGEDGIQTLGGIWDYRDDPAGLQFEGVDLEARATAVAEEWESRKQSRTAELGYMIQPAAGLRVIGRE